MDRRITPFSGRVALDSLRGQVDAPAFAAGEAAEVALPVADLLPAPGSYRDRQVLLGEALTVIDRRDGHAFVQAAKDGYCGWLAEAAVIAPTAPTHWVATPGSHLYTAPKVQAPEIAGITLGSRLQVLDLDGKFARTPHGFVPAVHLCALGDWRDDPVAVAADLLGTPYLWGGNSRAGIDCSGMAQAALTACGLACPGDSDLQQAIGTEVPEDQLRPGDLLFWKGHVAMVADGERLIHANGHRMAVTWEGIEACIARIMAQENHPVIARRRPG
ncbi:MAG: NlpC/P60 family protein [Paracoccaceae bacterium]